MNLRIEVEQEKDGRWIAEATDLPGVMVYGNSQSEALQRVKALALRVLHANPFLEGAALPSLSPDSTGPFQEGN